MGTIRVHEFITLDGVIEDPKWSFGFPFDPKMGAAIGAIMGGCSAILLGRRAPTSSSPRPGRGVRRSRTQARRS